MCAFWSDITSSTCLSALWLVFVSRYCGVFFHVISFAVLPSIVAKIMFLFFVLHYLDSNLRITPTKLLVDYLFRRCMPRSIVFSGSVLGIALSCVIWYWPNMNVAYEWTVCERFVKINSQTSTILTHRAATIRFIYICSCDNMWQK